MSSLRFIRGTCCGGATASASDAGSRIEEHPFYGYDFIHPELFHEPGWAPPAKVAAAGFMP